MAKDRTPEAAGAKPAAPIKLDDAREKAIDLLSECFARDMLSVEDFERRVSLAHAARSMVELGGAIEDLGAGAGVVTAQKHGSPAATLAEVRATDRAVAVFGETKRVGQWVPARSNTVVAVMGSAVIDLREARLGPGHTAFSVLRVHGVGRGDRAAGAACAVRGFGGLRKLRAAGVQSGPPATPTIA